VSSGNIKQGLRVTHRSNDCVVPSVPQLSLSSREQLVVSILDRL
jgi:hypothetical protein